MIPCRRYQFVELFIPAGTTGAGAQINFQDQPLLRTQEDKTVYIYGIETYSNQAFTLLPSGHTLATAAQIENATLWLSVGNFFRIKQMPLARMNNVYGDPANFVPFQQEPLIFDNLSSVTWTESYVQFSASPAGAVPFSFGFGVYYDIQPINVLNSY